MADSGAHNTVRPTSKLQAVVYDILPSTTAVFSYAIGSRKLSANEQFFVGAQTVVSLLQTQIISGICFITDHVAYASWNKTKIVWIETELFFLPGVLLCCLTSTEAGWPIRDGDRVGKGTGWLARPRNRPKKTGETVDRRQNNGSVKAVSPRHCPATCALRNCSFNCCAGQSH